MKREIRKLKMILEKSTKSVKAIQVIAFNKNNLNKDLVHKRLASLTLSSLVANVLSLVV